MGLEFGLGLGLGLERAQRHLVVLVERLIRVREG